MVAARANFARADARAVPWRRKGQLHGGTPAAHRSFRGFRQTQRPARRGGAGVGGPRAAQRGRWADVQCRT
jgi:hypothetical protein